ncbi:hypothetical protein ACRYCC_28100 [Actinomadura scrupuli]|uniref:hypothetical protein n=1 Tax=Actinomadura scrupuli TaxID=559629 RepID=UPI003D95F166
MAITVDDLSVPERRLWEAFPTGEWVDLRTGDEESYDPVEEPPDWGQDRWVRAEVVAALLAGAVPVEPGSVGVLVLQGARIEGLLDLAGMEACCRLALRGCWLGAGIQAEEARLRTVSLQGSLVGEVRLANAHIDGTFVLQGARLVNPDAKVLVGYGLTVKRDVRADGLVAEGEVDLIDAHIGGTLRLHGARLQNPGGNALLADGLTVTSGIYCRDGFSAEGTIRLRGAHIGSNLEMDGARLVNPGGHALSATRLTVAGSVFFRHGFTAEGEVRVLDGRIGGAFDLSGARLVNPGGEALSADGLRMDQNMILTGGFTAEGVVRLVSARIGAIEDDPWQWPDRLELNGLTYQELYPDAPARLRLGWLSRSAGGYRAQPYEQLAAHYRRLGHDEEARRVLLAKQRARMREQGWWARPWGWLQDVLAGYGYVPGRAALWLAAAFTVGSWYFARHHPAAAKADHPPFNTLLYTLDLLLPAPNLGQEDAFSPLHGGLALAAGLRVFGWVLTIAVLASITRALSRN